jgi:WD40 repeat protein
VSSLSACAAELDAPEQTGAVSAALTQAPNIRWSLTSAGGPVAFSPDGSSVATGSTQAVVQLVSAATGNQIRTFRIRGTANSVSFSPDGSLLVVGTATTPLNLRLFRVADATQVFQEKAAHANGTSAVAFADGCDDLRNRRA